MLSASSLQLLSGLPLSALETSATELILFESSSPFKCDNCERRKHEAIKYLPAVVYYYNEIEIVFYLFITILPDTHTETRYKN